MNQWILLFTLFVATNVFATFSIVAVDTATGEVGGAGASCIANSRIINDLIVGLGAIHTQSYYLPGNQQYARALMLAGVSPEDMVDSLEANDVTGDPEIRQYGMVDLVNGGRFASYTGSGCTDWAGHRVGANYAIQGNILLSQLVVDTMEWAFLNTPGRLDQKLMAAVLAARIPGADTRCLSANKSAISAFIRVVRPHESLNDPYCDLNVPNTTGSTEPLDLLEEQYEEWLEELETSADPVYSRVWIGRNLIQANGVDTTRVLILLLNNQGEPLDDTAEPDAWTSAGASFSVPEYVGDGYWSMTLTSLAEMISDTITVINYSGARPGELLERPVVIYGDLPNETSHPIPDSPALIRVFPNPFNSVIRIEIEGQLVERSVVTIRDLQGRTVTELHANSTANNTTHFIWSPESTAAGIYFVTANLSGNRVTQKALLLK